MERGNDSIRRAYRNKAWGGEIAGWRSFYSNRWCIVRLTSCSFILYQNYSFNADTAANSRKIFLWDYPKVVNFFHIKGVVNYWNLVLLLFIVLCFLGSSYLKRSSFLLPHLFLTPRYAFKPSSHLYPKRNNFYVFVLIGWMVSLDLLHKGTIFMWGFMFLCIPCLISCLEIKILWWISWSWSEMFH